MGVFFGILAVLCGLMLQRGKDKNTGKAVMLLGAIATLIHIVLKIKGVG